MSGFLLLSWGKEKGKGQFLGLSGLLESIVCHYCRVQSKQITNTDGISATSADDCIAPDWPMPH